MNAYDEKAKDKMILLALVGGGIVHLLNAVAGRNVMACVAGETASRVLLGLVGVAALCIASERDYYLPFLGDTVFPNGLLAGNVSPNNANAAVRVVVPPNTKVVYWAAEPCDTGCDPDIMAWDAYKGYSNSGVSTSDGDGNVTLQVRGLPQGYAVPYKDAKLKPHVHYRYLKHDGMFSKVITAHF